MERIERKTQWVKGSLESQGKRGGTIGQEGEMEESNSKCGIHIQCNTIRVYII